MKRPAAAFAEVGGSVAPEGNIVQAEGENPVVKFEQETDLQLAMRSWRLGFNWAINLAQRGMDPFDQPMVDQHAAKAEALFHKSCITTASGLLLP